MTAGRGFVAVALVIFAAWNPFRVMAGAYLFGAAITLGSELQVRGIRVNQFLLDAVPYLLTLVVLVALARRRSSAAPEALGQPV
jgi:simple sugar transport system permease protein